MQEPNALRTIDFATLKRLEFCNSDKLPQVANINGKRYQWIGIDWVDEGELLGDEVLVVDSHPPGHA